MPPDDQFVPIDVATWLEQAQEARGKRAKVWVRSPDDIGWLRKEPLLGRPFEINIEALTLWVARELSLPAPIAKLCTWGGKRGIVVANFAPSPMVLSHGHAELRRLNSHYDPSKNEMHSLSAIRQTLLDIQSSQQGADLVGPFVRMLVFDAWIGNGDRHQENWGLIRDSQNAPTLAPVYDTAACLGAELHDGHPLLSNPPEKDVERYMDRCPSGFGDETQQIGMEKALQVFADWPETLEEIRALLPRCRKVLHFISEFGETIAGLSAGRSNLAKLLLKRRLERLEGRV